MLVIGLGIAVTVCTALIALLSLAGGYPSMLAFFSRLYLCPARFFTNAMVAIEKLEALNEEGIDSQGEKYKIGTVRQGDVGFDELTQALKENRMLKGAVQEISLIEEKSGIGTASDVFGDVSPEVVRFLVLLKDGKREVLRTSPFDPSESTRRLKDWTEVITRRRLIGWIITVLAVLAILNVWLVIIR